MSKEHVSENMNLLVNKMELPIDHVVQHASLLKIILEKTMRPRCLVLQKIRTMGFPDLILLTLLLMPKAQFIRRIIKGHLESKTLINFMKMPSPMPPTPIA